MFYLPCAGDAQTDKMRLLSRREQLGPHVANRSDGCAGASWLEEAAGGAVLRPILTQQEKVLWPIRHVWQGGCNGSEDSLSDVRQQWFREENSQVNKVCTKLVKSKFPERTLGAQLSWGGSGEVLEGRLHSKYLIWVLNGDQVYTSVRDCMLCLLNIHMWRSQTSMWWSWRWGLGAIIRAGWHQGGASMMRWGLIRGGPRPSFLPLFTGMREEEGTQQEHRHLQWGGLSQKLNRLPWIWLSEELGEPEGERKVGFSPTIAVLFVYAGGANRSKKSHHKGKENCVMCEVMYVN